MSNEPEPRQSPPPDGPPPPDRARDRAFDESAGDASQPPVDDEPVPRLPRGRGLRLSFAEIMRILMIAAMLIAVLMLRRPCAESTGRFVESFEPPVDAGPARTPGQLPPGRYIPLSGEMTEQELRDRLKLLEQLDAGPEPAPASSSEPATGAAPDPAQPIEETSHDREPRSAPDRKPSSPPPDPR